MKDRPDPATRESTARAAPAHLDLRVPFGARGPVFVRTWPAAGTEPPSPWEPAAGDGVVLHSSDGVRILARIVEAENRRYVGEITSFGEFAIEHQGRRAGDRLVFKYADIVICWHHAEPPGRHARGDCS